MHLLYIYIYVHILGLSTVSFAKTVQYFTQISQAASQVYFAASLSIDTSESPRRERISRALSRY
jgi:hypothetical protein